MVDWVGARGHSVFHDYTRYRNSFGFQENNNEGHHSQNMLRWQAQYLLSLLIHKKLTYQEKVRTRQLVYTLFRGKAGLLSRSPDGGGGQESHDNYQALGLISYFLDKTLARAVLDRSPWLRYYQNVPERSFSAWLIRFPHLFAHLKWAAGRKPNIFELLYWCGATLLSSYGTSQDGKILGWFRVVVAYNRGFLSDIICRHFIRRCKLLYPKGPGELLAKYYQNDKHPDAKYLTSWDFFIKK